MQDATLLPEDLGACHALIAALSARVTSNRAIANFNLGKFQEALNDFDKTLSMVVKDSEALLNRGLTLKALNRKSEAMESFRKSCVAGNPKACKQLH